MITNKPVDNLVQYHLQKDFNKKPAEHPDSNEMAAKK